MATRIDTFARCGIAGRAPGEPKTDYDGLTILLHWTTALLVVILFVLAQTWNLLERGTPLRHMLQSLHVSLGLVFTAVLAARLLWRAIAGRKLVQMSGGFAGFAAKAMHYLLYVLLVVEAALGWSFRWAAGDPLSLFGLFSIPSPFDFTVEQRHAIAAAHNWVAISILLLAGAHALAAIFHHYALKDGILSRMVPILKRPAGTSAVGNSK
ncbi:MAG TPA: cytochrome b/b6 domain-containing protein [Dongiaceae bacterium]|nr:cytochrome b/b6 domain-containing protein [Dongiaceae bacterium]